MAPRTWVTAPFLPESPLQDLEEQLKSGGQKWSNRVQWVRQALLTKGEMASPECGVWAITEKGRARVGASSNSHGTTQSTGPLTLVALHDEYVVQFKANLLERLFELTPVQFELEEILVCSLLHDIAPNKRLVLTDLPFLDGARRASGPLPPALLG